MYVRPYKHLQDFEFVYRKNSNNLAVCVVQIDYKIGLTAKYMNPEISKDNNNNCICVNRSLYPTESQYNKVFNAYVKGISTGEIVAFNIGGHSSNMSPCAFS